MDNVARIDFSPQFTPFAAAPSLVARGFHVFPLVSGEKRPAVTKGFKVATQSQSQIEEWCSSMPTSNIGIATGSTYRLIVIDVDVKDDAPGMHSLDELHAQVHLPDTLTVKTWSDGLHLYYRLPERVKVRSRVGILPGIDIRADGGYVVAPPSVVRQAHAAMPTPPLNRDIAV